ncbi:ABC transporter ATP-binding protein [Streptomyces aidingensis]|uniref:ABC-2 type transport system ATP-binding protein n=1 Tax=Streptomyces aidingensis TaxID=910347 RepID=A0A1I1MS58_9ACTN|nr:ABC transporter ATP-binding protein [Streptomyces aidingensis]SFC88211.1 ABC-2 type transport system ATP-binding protein [Streptomyces aidingensis]
MLEAVALTKRYDDIQALDGFTLNVAAGEIVGLVGHNGAGKTTFVEMVSGLLKPDSGTVLVDGRPPSEARGIIGISPQHIALYRPLTVREHLELYGSLAGLRRAALREAVEELAVALHLTAFLDRRAGFLSGGQQRRTQAGAALIHRPSLLLLDEPTAGADPETRQALLEVVRRRAGEGAAVVYTTHYLTELMDLGATLAVAAKGRIIARGTSAELLEGLPGEVRVTAAGQELHASTTDPTASLLDLLRTAPRPVESVELRKPTLDDLYHSLAVTDGV